MNKKRLTAILFIMAIAVVCSSGLQRSEASEKTGEQLFKEHCSLCHPDGGNIINPKKTLLKKDREINKIKSPEDIITIMRKPGPGMTAFDIKSISDEEARKIADYVFKKFNK